MINAGKAHSDEVKWLLLAIRERRKKLAYTQEYMAFKMQVSQNAYSKLELGLTRLSLAHFFLICELLDSTPEKLLLKSLDHRKMNS